MAASTSVLVERWFRDLDEVRRGMHVPLAVVSAQQGHAQHPCDLAIHHVLLDDAMWPERRTSTVAGLYPFFSSCSGEALGTGEYSTLRSS
jgi:hypothetical protein